MARDQGVLHLILDSREQSISAARQFYVRAGQPRLGTVEHIRHCTFDQRFSLLMQTAAPGDQILVSLSALAPEHLEAAGRALDQWPDMRSQVTLVSFACFDHIPIWCGQQGIQFVANQYQRRLLSPQAEARIRRFLSGEIDRLQEDEQEILARIWIQYRLMIAIISRSRLLGDIARELIAGQPALNASLTKEYCRALRYYKLGELDMAGGTYACEKDTGNAIDHLRQRIGIIAATDYNVLVQGESGSGKETVAWAIHELSARRDQPFLTINCAGLSDELLESEMYGYVKGSHNQAVNDHPGLLATANGGTVFLDELPEMGPRVQAKFLRMLESGEYRPLGGSENRYTDVRIIAAGQTELLNDPFRVRRDLMSRIAQLRVDILPLRDLEKIHPGTLQKIFYVLLERYTWTTVFRDGSQYQLTPKDIKTYQESLEMDGEALAMLVSAEWKESNIRQLNNFIRQWLVFGGGEFSRFPVVHKQGAPADALSAQDPVSLAQGVDGPLKYYLQPVRSREEFGALFGRHPLKELKKAYLQHLAEVYEGIVADENQRQGTTLRPTQKELASLIGISEYTLSRYRN